METKQGLVASINEEIERLRLLAKAVEDSEEPDLRPLTNLADLLKERRANLGLSPQDVSELGGLSSNTYRALENGSGNPTIQTLQMVGRVLNFDMWIELK